MQTMTEVKHNIRTFPGAAHYQYLLSLLGWGGGTGGSWVPLTSLDSFQKKQNKTGQSILPGCLGATNIDMVVPYQYQYRYCYG